MKTNMTRLRGRVPKGQRLRFVSSHGDTAQRSDPSHS